MNNIEVYNDLRELCNKYKLGNIIEEPTSIHGGLMHKMFRVTTSTNVYAIKWLNPSIMQRKSVMENMIKSELIANSFSKYLSVVAALNVEGNNVLYTNEKYYMVFNWIEGASVFPPLITKKHCYEIGYALGRMHHLDITVPGIEKHKNEPITYDWEKLFVKGKEQNAYWAGTYAIMIHKLIEWNKLINDANNTMTELLVISHRDLDPKNVMWHQDIPYIIDWESAGYTNPYQELLEVLNYWANDGKGKLVKENFKTLLNAYREHMSTIEVNWDSVLNSGYAGMLGWLEYSLKRALGIECADEEERELGAEQVIGTIKELERYDNQVTLLKEWLSE